MLNWADNYLLDQLRFLPGVGQVTVGGFSQRNLRVWVDTKKLNEEYLTIRSLEGDLNYNL